VPSNQAKYFIPTIINELGYSAQAAQVRSIPIYIVAAIFSIAAAWVTDRLQHRYSFCMLGIIISSIGYVLLLTQKHLSVGVRYFALFLVTPGGYITQPIILAWVQNCMAGHYKRAVAAGMTVGFGNMGGIVASNIFITSEAPRYPAGYGTSLGLLWIAAAACTVMFFGVQAENRKRDRGERDHRLNEADADNLGDDHPAFRFTT
jgi:dipeptide/tripeptide permease